MDDVGSIVSTGKQDILWICLVPFDREGLRVWRRRDMSDLLIFEGFIDDQIAINS